MRDMKKYGESLPVMFKSNRDIESQVELSGKEAEDSG